MCFGYFVPRIVVKAVDVFWGPDALPVFSLLKHRRKRQKLRRYSSQWSVNSSLSMFYWSTWSVFKHLT
jgi:hypothetical protein